VNKLVLFDWGNIVESHQTGYTCYDAWNELFNLCGYNELNIFEKIKKYKLSSIKDIDTFSKYMILLKKNLILIKHSKNL